MPANDYTPQAWLGTQQLIEHFAGQTLITLNGTNVQGPAGWTAFSDIRMLINGRAGFADNTMDATAVLNAKAALAGAPGVWSMYIHSNDRVRIESTVPFETRGISPLYGLLPVATDLTAVAVGGGVYRVEASADWQRGPCSAVDMTLVLQEPGGAGWVVPVIFPDGTHDGVAQALTHAFNVSIGGDPEGRPTDNFAQLCVTATANSDAVRLSLNAQGRVVFAVDNAYASPALTTDFMAWLGFDGTEVFTRVVTLGYAMKEATATHLPAGLAPLFRPVRLDPHVYSQGKGVIMSDAHVDRSHVYTVVGYDVTFTPMGRSAANPTAMQLIRGFYSTLWRSAFMTVWQNHKESRQAVAESAGYDGLNTGEWDLGVGFLRLVVHPTYSEQLLALQNERSYKLYQPVTIPCLPYVRKD